MPFKARSVRTSDWLPPIHSEILEVTTEHTFVPLVNMGAKLTSFTMTAQQWLGITVPGSPTASSSNAAAHAKISKDEEGQSQTEEDTCLQVVPGSRTPTGYREFIGTGDDVMHQPPVGKAENDAASTSLRQCSNLDKRTSRGRPASDSRSVGRGNRLWFEYAPLKLFEYEGERDILLVAPPRRTGDEDGNHGSHCHETGSPVTVPERTGRGRSRSMVCWSTAPQPSRAPVERPTGRTVTCPMPLGLRGARAPDTVRWIGPLLGGPLTVAHVGEPRPGWAPWNERASGSMCRWSGHMARRDVADCLQTNGSVCSSMRRANDAIIFWRGWCLRRPFSRRSSGVGHRLATS